MLTREENTLLTRVTGPLRQLLRRYWHPVAAAGELTEEKPIRAVKILGEELAVYRDKKGTTVWSGTLPPPIGVSGLRARR
jgi:5,5'-dehydrodivanillate O-demethylase